MAQTQHDRAFRTAAVGSHEWHAQAHDSMSETWSEGVISDPPITPGMLNRWAIMALHHSMIAEFLRGRVAE
jgi:hypothetical protein